jgi:hypothetical protein
VGRARPLGPLGPLGPRRPAPPRVARAPPTARERRRLWRPRATAAGPRGRAPMPVGPAARPGPVARPPMGPGRPGAGPPTRPGTAPPAGPRAPRRPTPGAGEAARVAPGPAAGTRRRRRGSGVGVGGPRWPSRRARRERLRLVRQADPARGACAGRPWVSSRRSCGPCAAEDYRDSRHWAWRRPGPGPAGSERLVAPNPARQDAAILRQTLVPRRPVVHHLYTTGRGACPRGAPVSGRAACPR